jgi:type I restriction enzyme S subunit
MKAGWQTKNLGDVCNIVGGGTPPKDKPTFYSGDIPWATVRDLKQEVITSTEFKITKEAVKVSSTNIIPGGNVVIATRVGLGKVCLLGQDTAINQDLRGIIPINAKTLDVRFLFWWLKRIADLIVAEGTGATVQGVKLPFVKALQIPLPPLPEQHRIVAILDEAFDSIATAKANAEKNLQNARALFESHLQSVFTQRGEGWVGRMLENCCEKILAGGDVPKGRVAQERTPQYSVPIYSNGAKDDGLYGFTDVANVMKPSVTISARGTIGFSAIRTEPFLPVVRLIALIPDNEIIDISFLHYAVLGMDFGNTGTSIPQLTVPNIRNRQIYYPTLSQQKSIVAKLDELRDETQRLESLYQRKLAALDALKKSLLHQAFSGTL